MPPYRTLSKLILHAEITPGSRISNRLPTISQTITKLQRYEIFSKAVFDRDLSKVDSVILLWQWTSLPNITKTGLVHCNERTNKPTNEPTNMCANNSSRGGDKTAAELTWLSVTKSIPKTFQPKKLQHTPPKTAHFINVSTINQRIFHISIKCW